MKRDDKKYQQYLQILHEELIPAMGCTEPIAVALCVAKATETLGCKPEKIQAFLSANILKNAMGVGIPGTGMIGLPIAIALGALIGKSEYQLEVLKDSTPEAVEDGKKLIDSKAIEIALKYGIEEKLYIEVICEAQGQKATAIISGGHTHFVYVSRNDEVLLNKQSASTSETENQDVELNLRKVYDFAMTTPVEEIRFILETRNLNKKAAERSFKGKNDGFKPKGEGFKGGRNFKTRDEGRETRDGFKTKRDGYKGKPAAERSYPKYNPNKVTGEIRLNRFVAQSGLCSRREADDFIAAGLVSVNGVIVTELGTKVWPTDVVKFNDERLQGEKNVYLVLNKPKGYVTTLEDDHAEKTVMELVQNACKERIYPVGRLDKNSLGLLLFTNDGDITRQLTHPSLRKKKIYEVTLDKALTRADLEQLAEGITLEDGDIYFDEISYIKDDKKSVGVEIHSGRNRIVRRMFEHLGYKVTKLDRVYYAGLTKKNLKRGAWRFLTSDEVARLKAGRYE
jgi:23S rRNA pseudouridine2605 synthase